MPHHPGLRRDQVAGPPGTYCTRHAFSRQAREAGYGRLQVQGLVGSGLSAVSGRRFQAQASVGRWFSVLGSGYQAGGPWLRLGSVLRPERSAGHPLPWVVASVLGQHKVLPAWLALVRFRSALMPVPIQAHSGYGCSSFRVAIVSIPGTADPQFGTARVLSGHARSSVRVRVLLRRVPALLRPATGDPPTGYG